ncbi:MAG: peptide MFS transporter [Lacibacter sp.]
MNDVKSTSKHPQGLFVLFFTEMWERFSYYGMRAIFTLYMTKALLFDKSLSSNIYGSYTGLVYLTPLIGGYVADRYWGNRRSIFWGGLMMAFGQFMMFFSASNYQNPGFATVLMWVGLTGLIIGNGFFKPNISTMVGQLYPQGDKRLDAAYTLFYMGINLGAFISPLVCGALGDTGNAADFKWGFLAAGIGMLIGTISFELAKNKYVVTPEGEDVGKIPNSLRLAKKQSADDIASAESQHPGSLQPKAMLLWAGICIALIAVFKFVFVQDWIGSIIFAGAISAMGLIITDPSLSKIERERIIVIYIAAFFVVFFWAAFEQAGASLTYFADEQTNRYVGINTGMWAAIGFVLLFCIIIYWVLTRILSIPKEYKLFFFYPIAAILAGLMIYYFINPKPYSLPEIPASWFNSVNAIFIVVLAPLFAELWGWLGKKNLEPSSLKKQSIGLLLLGLGYVVIAIGVKDISDKVSMMWLITLYFLHTVGELCLSPIGLSLVNKLAPARFASLLMGVWFLANATANKFAGTLSALYPESGKTTSFLGYQMSNLNDFFNLFIYMSIAASVVVWVLSYRLEKMMHGVK